LNGLKSDGEGSTGIVLVPFEMIEVSHFMTHVGLYSLVLIFSSLNALPIELMPYMDISPTVLSSTRVKLLERL